MSDRYEGRGYGLEIEEDLNRRCTESMSDEDREVVMKARNALLYTLGILTCDKPPEPMTENDVEMLGKWLTEALRFRNIIRSRFHDIENGSETLH